MEIFELAAELGKKLKDDARLVRLEAARTAYESNDTILELSTEYATQQMAIQQESVKEDRDEALIDAINARVEELYKQLVATDVYKEFEAAQNEVTELMNRVNDTINAQIVGEMPDGCTHDCSTCGGCH